MRLRALLILPVAVALLSGCGSSAGGLRLRPATLALDFAPNAVHAGIYSALGHHYDRIDGVRLQVVAPSASTDPIKLLEGGRVNFSILDIHDLAIARERGQDIVGVMAIVERPLSAVIAAPWVRSPRQLQGKVAGITGVPSDTAVLRSIVAGAGGDPGKVRAITIGFNAVADLLARRVVAATGFWNDEGITLARRRRGFHSFRVDDYGAPSYPELVLCVTRRTLRSDPGLVSSVVRTVVYGYGFTLSNPERSALDLEQYVPGLDPRLVAAQLASLLPAFRAPDGKIGELDRSALQSWARWEARFGIVGGSPEVGRAFDPSLASAADSVVR